jgi:EAL domain-containing protein (putative c-di-GMP-specific phosphodiesterase class I)
LRTATFAAPAVGLLGDASRLLRLLHRHEVALAERLRAEVELATARLHRPADDVGARARIEAALQPGAIETVYQPIYSLATGDLAAVEALTRFTIAPARPPDLWFAEAHAVGARRGAGSCRHRSGSAGISLLPPNVAVNLNVSPKVLVAPELAPLLTARTSHQLVVEITEHAAVDDYQQLVTALGSLRQRGVRLAIDDAGAGFASMRHIVRLVPDIIKLDISLTRDIHCDPVRRALAVSLVRFADQIGALLVAEGVEQLDELRTCQELGVHAAQGYLLGRPGALPVRPYSEVVPRPTMAIAHPTHDRRQSQDDLRVRSFSNPGR